MRSASPRSIRFKMTAGVRYRRCRVTASVALALARKHTWQWLDEHAARFRIDPFDDVLDGRYQDLTFLAADDVDVVGARFDDVHDFAQVLVAGGVFHAQADDLVPVELAFGQAHRLLGGHFDFGTTQERGFIAVLDFFQLQEHRTALDAGTLDDVRLASDKDRVAPFEPPRRKVRHDAALHLAAYAVRSEHVGHHEKLG